MKAIILAAGRGTRLGKYTKEIPKGLLKVAGKTILDIQIECYHNVGITDISIVKGYKGNAIDINGVKYYWNNDFESTNMVVSLMCAAAEFTDDIIISYADIMFDPDLLIKIIKSKSDAVVLGDSNWEKYWLMRYGNVNYDLESLIVNQDDNIVEIGRPIVSKEDMMLRYIGIIKFSKQCVLDVIDITKKASTSYHNIPWKWSGKPYPNSYMTDLIQALIDKHIDVKVEKVINGWVEFDTQSDYERVMSWITDGEINALFKDFNALIK